MSGSEPESRLLMGSPQPPVDLSVVVPCHNEGATVAMVVEEIMESWGDRNGLEIVLVNDASTDNTRKVIDSLSRAHQTTIQSMHRESRGGLGGALSTGFNAASGSVLTWLPGDGEYKMQSLLPALRLISECDMVLARRTTRGQFTRGVVSLVMHFLTRSLFSIDLRGFSGIFMLRQENWVRLRIQGRSGFFTLEAAINARSLGLTFEWIETPWTQRSQGSSSVFNPRVIVKSLIDLISLRLRLSQHHYP